LDANFWRLTPLVLDRFRTPRFPVEPLGPSLIAAQYGSSALSHSEPIGVPILRMNSLRDDGWDLSDLKYIQLNERELENYRLQPGDILFNRTNSKELVGKCEVFREAGDWVFASYLIRVRTNQARLIPQFASDFLGTGIGRMQIDRVSRQIIGMTNINAEEIRELLIPIPSVDQQKKLVAEMDAARNERRKNLAKADELLGEMDAFILDTLGLKPPIEDKRRVFAITRREVPSRYDPHFHAPEFEQIQRMLALTTCESLSRLAKFSSETWRPAEHDDPTFRYIEISTVNSKTGEAAWNEVPTKEAPSRARMRIRTDDIIVSLTRPHHGSIALLESRFDGSVASTGFAVIREISDTLRRDYLWCVLRAVFCLRQMLQRSSGGNYPAITEHELGNVTVPVPAPDVQERIAKEA
jgi:type I restriction enzyme S subunit